MYDPRVVDLLEGAQAFSPDVAFAFRSIGPKKLFDVRTLCLVSKADEVIEVAIGHTLYVHENGRALDG